MKKKCKCPPAGAPEWLATFSDMMSLLLCFFVLIVAFSEVKEEDKYQSVVEELQTALGMHGGGARLPTDEDPEMSLIQKLIAQALYNQREPRRSNNMDPGTQGRENEVSIVRQGEQVAVGGRVTFEPGSAVLSARAVQQLQEIAEQLRGKANVINIKGHAETAELLQRPESGFEDLWALSLARSRAVMDYLAGPEGQVEVERMRLVGCADTEPVKHRADSVSGQEPNRRVEVFEAEKTVQDMAPPE